MSWLSAQHPTFNVQAFNVVFLTPFVWLLGPFEKGYHNNENKGEAMATAPHPPTPTPRRKTINTKPDNTVRQTPSPERHLLRTTSGLPVTTFGHSAMPLQTTTMADYPPFDPDPDPDPDSGYSDSSDYYEGSPDSSTGSDLSKDGTVTYGDDEAWPTSIRYSYNGFSDLDVVDQYHPHLEAGHVLPIDIPPYSFLVMIVTVLPGFLHGATPGQVTNYPTGGNEPGKHRTLFIGHKQYLIRILEFIEDDDTEEGSEDDPEEDFEEDFVGQESSELWSPHDIDNLFSLESGVEGLTVEDDGGLAHDGSDWELEWEEDSEWEWGEWTPESIESFSTLPLYSSPSRTPPPPPYASPSQASIFTIDPPAFEHSPSSTPRVATEGQTQTPGSLGSVLSRDVRRPSSSGSRLDSRVGFIDSDDEEGSWEEETDSDDSVSLPPFTPVPGESALWTGTEEGGPIALPRRDLPHTPTMTPQIGTPMAFVNIQNPSAGLNSSSVISIDHPRQPLAPRPRLSPLDMELPQPLPSTSTAAASTNASRYPADTVAGVTPVASSSTSRMPIVVEISTSPPSVHGGGTEQIPSSPVIHDGYNAQVTLPIGHNLHVVPQDPSSLTRNPCGSHDNAQFPTQSPVVSPDVRNLYDSPLRRADDPRSPTYIYNTQVISPTSSDLPIQDSPRQTSSMDGSYISDQPLAQSPLFGTDVRNLGYNSPRMAHDPRSPRCGYNAQVASPTSPNLQLTSQDLSPRNDSLWGSYISDKLIVQSPCLRTDVRNLESDSSPSTLGDPRSPRYPMVLDLLRPGIRGSRNSPPHEIGTQCDPSHSQLSTVPGGRVNEPQGHPSSSPWDTSYAQDGGFPLPSPTFRCKQANDLPVGLEDANEDFLTTKEHQRWLAERRRMFPEPAIWPAALEETATSSRARQRLPI